MKKIMIICDRCDKEIKTYPMKLIADYTKRVDGKDPEGYTMPEIIRKAIQGECDRDYCEGCMQEILDFAHQNIDLQTFVAEKKEEIAEEAEIDAKAMVLTDGKIKKLLKPGQIEMIEQLLARGMSEKDISRDMGVERYLVRYLIGEMKKAG